MLMMCVLWALAGPDLCLVAAADAHDAPSLGQLPSKSCLDDGTVMGGTERKPAQENSLPHGSFQTSGALFQTLDGRVLII